MSPRREEIGQPDAEGRPGYLDGWILSLAGKCVPGARRREWAKEWQAELWHLRHEGRRFGYRRGGRLKRLSLAYGIMADALWLRLNWERENAHGSAASCLYLLAAYCLLFAVAERVLAGSWDAFIGILVSHFLNGFIIVAVPAIFAAVATYPLRPLRCDRRHAGAGGYLSTRARWNLFLAVKVMLTLVLGFLATLVATAPVRMLMGRPSDWVELLLSSLVVTAGLRWALLNQEQRCQKCLRMMGKPTRVGPSSRNFLDWSGTELACTDGHGLLHVPEMQGSWCWYDLWVEVEPGWSSLSSS